MEQQFTQRTEPAQLANDWKFIISHGRTMTGLPAENIFPTLYVFLSRTYVQHCPHPIISCLVSEKYDLAFHVSIIVNILFIHFAPVRFRSLNFRLQLAGVLECVCSTMIF